MDKKIIPPDEWTEYLADFSSRNQGRRARFEAFDRGGVAEEDEEAVFESVSVANSAATVRRIVRADDANAPITDEIYDVRGISVQLDSDGSDNTMEFMNSDGDVIVLHFESAVDGDS